MSKPSIGTLDQIRKFGRSEETTAEQDGGREFLGKDFKITLDRDEDLNIFRNDILYKYPDL